MVVGNIIANNHFFSFPPFLFLPFNDGFQQSLASISLCLPFLVFIFVIVFIRLQS